MARPSVLEKKKFKMKTEAIHDLKLESQLDCKDNIYIVGSHQIFIAFTA